MEGDWLLVFLHILIHRISIHSLRMEGDGYIYLLTSCAVLFQSTPSAWRETSFLPICILFIHISIHSLRMEGDVWHIGLDG